MGAPSPVDPRAARAAAGTRRAGTTRHARGSTDSLRIRVGDILHAALRDSEAIRLRAHADAARIRAANADPAATAQEPRHALGQRPEPGFIAARALALRMTVQGQPRAVIAERLRSEYGIADAEPLLAEIFGRPRDELAH